MFNFKMLSLSGFIPHVSFILKSGDIQQIKYIKK